MYKVPVKYCKFINFNIIFTYLVTLYFFVHVVPLFSHPRATFELTQCIYLIVTISTRPLAIHRRVCFPRELLFRVGFATTSFTHASTAALSESLEHWFACAYTNLNGTILSFSFLILPRNQLELEHQDYIRLFNEQSSPLETVPLRR